MADKAVFESLSRVGSVEASQLPISADTTSQVSTTVDHDTEKRAEAVQADLVAEHEKDPNLVDWSGPDDPEKAINWSKKRKWKNVILIALLTLLTPFDSSMFAPGVPQMMREFKSDNVDLASFTVSIYVLGYAFGPLIIAPLSELYGRIPVYHVNTVLFVLFNIGCAESTSLPMLIVFRFLTGLAGSCPITIGSGTIADCFRQEERGWVMSAWTAPILLGPALGPVVGGYLSQGAGWRWDFWFIVIVTGVVGGLTFIFLDETYPPILLQRKVRRLQKETQIKELHAPQLANGKTPMQLFFISIVRPSKMLALSPIVFSLSLYVAVCYGYLYLMFSTMTEVFGDQYGIDNGNVGLTFLGLGVGQFVGLVVFGYISDSTMKRLAKKNHGEMKPEFRLPPLLPFSFFMPVGLFWYGWSAQAKVHWMVPITGTVFVGTGMLLVFMPIGLYLVDAFTIYAASAMAANTVLRSLGGALLPLAGRRMYSALGLGWGNSLLAFIALAFTPAIWALMKYAERIRTHPKFQIEL